MAFPPSYSDLGKSARDVFNKGYGFGMVKLELKTKSSSGVEFAATGSSNTDTGKASGSLETKYKIKDYGLTFTQKWNTDNTLGTEVSMEDQVRSRYPENVSRLCLGAAYTKGCSSIQHSQNTCFFFKVALRFSLNA
uniref:Non-selective voltage-gated ion channel VDAC3 n=1 Tax=Strix occidentalis caurina TaxID=311401 RepID=A0A8D0EW55_STROC